MNDPYCGWNIRKGSCEEARLNKNLLTLNANLCSRIVKQDQQPKPIQLDINASIQLECNINDNYLLEHVEWKKDQIPIEFETDTNKNLFITSKKELIILNGNSTQNGVYSCYLDKTELINSYSILYKETKTKSNESPGVTSTLNQSKKF
jgi:hypothetical protein